MKVAFVLSCLLLLALSACNEGRAPASSAVAAGSPGTGDGTRPANVAPQVAWARFEDPVEHAFVLDVPAGWTVRGGMYRKGVLDPRSMVDVTSPDGKINYRIGDASIPPYTIPTPLMMQLGFREGSPYNPGGRVRGMVAHFRPGPQFADLYGQARFSTTCGKLEVKAIRNAAPLYPFSSPVGGENTAGEAFFKCADREIMAAYVYAQTTLTGSRQSGIWGALILYSFIAPESQASQAMRLLSHSLGSVQQNPQWLQYQNRLIGQANRDIGREMNQSLEQSHQRMAQLEQRSRSQQDFDDIINGVTLTRDPVSGEQREVWSGQYEHHWLSPTDKVVNTPTNNSPGINYRELQNIQR